MHRCGASAAGRKSESEPEPDRGHRRQGDRDPDRQPHTNRLRACIADADRFGQPERNAVGQPDALSVDDADRVALTEPDVARLMSRDGLRRVQVCGGSGDLGADVTAYTEDGRKVVVQCKRYAGSVGDPHVQKFNGTARQIHGADVALLVTTGRPTVKARQLAQRCGIVLVDRDALAAWATDRILPAALSAPAKPARSTGAPTAEREVIAPQPEAVCDECRHAQPRTVGDEIPAEMTVTCVGRRHRQFGSKRSRRPCGREFKAPAAASSVLCPWCVTVQPGPGGPANR
jgi:restriction system protein